MNSSAAARPLSFVLWTFASQLVGAGAGVFIALTWQSPAAALAAAALLAWLLSFKLRLPWPYQLLNLLLPPAAALSLGLAVPPAWWAALAILTLLIFAPTFWTRVPFYPTRRSMYALIAEQLPTDREFRLVDLGCGFGSMLFFLARQRPHGHFCGVELSPLPWLWAKARSLLSGGRVSIKWQNFWQLDLAAFDVIYAFLAPPPMPALGTKLKREIQPGTLVLINSFPLPGRADAELKLHEGHGGQLFIYRFAR